MALFMPMVFYTSDQTPGVLHRHVSSRSVKIPRSLTARLLDVSRTTRPAACGSGAASDGKFFASRGPENPLGHGRCA
jgi:hypothetical protein